MTTGWRVLKMRRHAREDLLAEGLELGPAVVDGGTVDGAKDAVRDVGRSRDLQEMATGWHGFPSVVVRRGPRASLRPAGYFWP